MKSSAASARDGREEKGAKTEEPRSHASPLRLAAGCREKRAQNSVHSASDLNRRSSPPCSRTSSRARFKPEPVSRHVFTALAARWKRSKMYGCASERDAAAGVGHAQLHLLAVRRARGDADGPAAAVIFARVIEKILHDQRVYFVSPAICKSSGISVSTWRSARLRHRLEIVEPFLDQVREVDRVADSSAACPASIRESSSRSSTTPVSR